MVSDTIETYLVLFTGDRSKWDQIWLVKIGQIHRFCVYRRSCFTVVRPPVNIHHQATPACTTRRNQYMEVCGITAVDDTQRDAADACGCMVNTSNETQQTHAHVPGTHVRDYKMSAQ